MPGKTARPPAFSPPALATLVAEPPSGEGWLYEVKFDGYRVLAAIAGEQVRLNTRSGQDWTHRFGDLKEELAALDFDRVLVDGEIACLDEQGRSDFGALQAALSSRNPRLTYFVFDLLVEGGRSLRDRPLRERKERLAQLLDAAKSKGRVSYVDHIEGDGERLLAAACEQRLEGLIAKRADDTYPRGRTRSWLKLKCRPSGEFVVVGWSPSDRNRPFSSLLLGARDHGELTYAGRVGSGFGADDLTQLGRRLQALRVDGSPLASLPSSRAVRGAHWVRPALVAQVEHAGLTRDGLVRQARFLGLREDKRASDIVRERPAGNSTMQRRDQRSASGRVDVAGVSLSSPDKVLYPEQGITKLELARYLEQIAARMLPHAARRLVSFVRCPQGRSKSCFFQRHAGQGAPPALRAMRISTGRGKSAEPYVYFEDVTGLVSTAQIGVLELHIWGSRIDRIERPDRIVFDLDPDASLGFDAVRKAARELRDVLLALDLTSFALVTGGKGMHVVVPIERRHEWPVVRRWSGALAARMAAADPQRYVAQMSKARRRGRIFIDYLRNDRSATTICPYSMRRHEGAPLAWPVGWDDLDRVRSASDMRLTALSELLKAPDPWRDYGEVRQTLKQSAIRAVSTD